MKIEKKTLLKALNFAKLAVAKKGEVEQLTHFFFTGDEIVTFNNQMAVFLEFKSDFICSIKADIFFKQLSKFSSSEISMGIVKGKLVLKGDKEKAAFSIVSTKDDEVAKILHVIQNDHVDCERLPLPGNFGIGAAFASFSASKNNAQGVLSAIRVSGEYVYSTDNYRATQFRMESSIADDLLIRREVANNFNDFNIREYSIGENWLSFYCDDGVTISTRRIYGEYPDFSQAFELDDWEIIEFPETIIDAIDFVSIIVAKDEKLNRIGKVVIEGNEVTISTDRFTEATEKTIQLTDTTIKNKMEFAINLEFFKTIVQHTLKLNYNAETQRAMFTNGCFKHLIRMALI